MSIKDFSEKHGVGLFYSTIILAILTITFGFMALCGGSNDKRGDFKGQQGQPQGMMQNKGNNNQQVPTQTGTQPTGTQSVPTDNAPTDVPAGS